jgi:hypothetical protein
VAVLALVAVHVLFDDNEWRDLGSQMNIGLVNFPWFTPVAFEKFDGKYDPDKLRPLFIGLPVNSH